jgi:hypothetical protein
MVRDGGVMRLAGVKVGDGFTADSVVLAGASAEGVGVFTGKGGVLR